MASKSKRRRRVLGASCILAALIIAASSFAWFTSKDEVTNRLTSTADYGVSIVESFSPPANWIPGQEVNKDVFAVNTGSVDAFVREDVSGVISFTYEKLAASFNAETAVKLDETTVDGISGITTMEAGSFLAWTDVETEQLGEKSISADGSSWKPTTTGNYIFRRSIDGNAFTYAGYHFVKGTGNEPDKYYKIVIGDDKYPTQSGEASLASTGDAVFDVNVSSTQLGTGISADSTGIINGDPLIRYAVEANVVKQPVTMVYQPASTGENTGNNARLKIEYVAGMDQLGGVEEGYDASAAAARAEVNYYNAKGNSDDKTAIYQGKKADYDYAVALAQARDDLYAAAETRKDVADAQDTADNGNDTARGAVNTAAGGLETDYANLIGTTQTPDISKDTIVPAEVRTAINSYTPELTQAKANLRALDDLWDSRITVDINAIKTALTTLKGTNVTAADAAAAAQSLKNHAADLKAALSLYKDKYAELVTESTAANITGLNVSTSGTHKTNINTQLTNATNLDTAINTANTGIVALSDAYTAKAAAKSTADANSVAANTVWAQAVAAYNAAVGNPSVTEPATAATGATLTYENGVDEAKTTAALTGRQTNNITNNASALVPMYSANITADETNPQIAANAVYTDYIGISNPAQPDDTDVTTAESAMNTALSTTNQMKGKYDDAKAVLTQSSTITIYVNLAENSAWTFDTTTSGTQTASFYLNMILDAGVTSEMLIDSVVLADSVTAGQYKELTFDLNVGLESAQVTYDDNRQITTEAVAGTFAMTPTVNQSTKAVTWANE